MRTSETSTYRKHRLRMETGPESYEQRYECDNDKSVVSDCVFIVSNVVSVILDIYEFEMMSFPLWKR